MELELTFKLKFVKVGVKEVELFSIVEIVVEEEEETASKVEVWIKSGLKPGGGVEGVDSTGEDCLVVAEEVEVETLGRKVWVVKSGGETLLDVVEADVLETFAERGTEVGSLGCCMDGLWEEGVGFGVEWDLVAI